MCEPFTCKSDMQLPGCVCVQNFNVIPRRGQKRGKARKIAVTEELAENMWIET